MTMRDELVQIMMEMVDPQPGTVLGYAAILIWHRILEKFSSVITPYSAYALFLRSLDANRAGFPWLPAARKMHDGREAFEEFEDLILIQTTGDMDRAMRALLGTYFELLFALIGISLTVQIVCSLASQRSSRE